MTSDFSRIFTLLVDGQSTLTFEARTAHEAQQLCKELWLREDLRSLSTNGVPLWNGSSALLTRAANDEEAGSFNRAAAEAKPSDDMLLVYLVELDGAGRRPNNPATRK